MLKNIVLTFFLVCSVFKCLPDMASAVHSTRNSPSGERLVSASQRKMSLTKAKNKLGRLNQRFASYIDRLEEKKRKLKNDAR